MRTIHSPHYRSHDPDVELHAGELVQPFENPQRVDMILEAVNGRGLGEVIEPRDFGLAPIEAVHDASYLQFLQGAHALWKSAGHKGDALPWFWPNRTVERLPDDIASQLGFYARAGDTPITAGSWLAAYWSAQVAVEGARRIVEGERTAFSLCRPPGHHASIAAYGGYCFLNNAAIAAAYLREQQFAVVAVVDIDFHHGDGTQQIFYDRSDIVVGSVHGDPQFAFPGFSGYADECGTDAGRGANLNVPLPRNTGFADWSRALGTLLDNAAAHDADALIVSLGVDTYRDDPISFFDLGSEDYLEVGRQLAGFRKPTLFVMEGGYAMSALGENTVNVLAGFETRYD